MICPIVPVIIAQLSFVPFEPEMLLKEYTRIIIKGMIKKTKVIKTKGMIKANLLVIVNLLTNLA